MKKIYIVFLIFIGLFLTSVGNANACFVPDASFTLNIRDLTFAKSYDELLKMCSPENCVIGEENFIIKSFYDSRVAIVINKETHDPTSFGLIIKLPYAKDESIDYKKTNQIVVTTVDPEKYNWQESVKKDLTELNNLGIIKMSNGKINKISKFADSGKNIMKCGFFWKQLHINEYCAKNKSGLGIGWLLNIFDMFRGKAEMMSKSTDMATKLIGPCSGFQPALPEQNFSLK